MPSNVQFRIDPDQYDESMPLLEKDFGSIQRGMIELVKKYVQERKTAKKGHVLIEVTSEAASFFRELAGEIQTVEDVKLFKRKTFGLEGARHERKLEVVKDPQRD